VGRLIVVRGDDATRAVGIVTRSDLLDAHTRRLDDASHRHVALALPKLRRQPRARDASR
jgi:CBS domain-containing protein